MKYKIFFEETQIGVLEINEKGQHKYTPDEEGTEKVKSGISIFYEILVASDWRDPIPFFQNRLNDAKRFEQEEEISNQTDSFRMIKEE